jgi:diaminopimelate epimerase
LGNFHKDFFWKNMASFYDARGNTYFVASPNQIGGLPESALEAARTHAQWAAHAIESICARENPPEGSKKYRSDGLLVGPFKDGEAFGLLIVNTDATLAERSGNGLTIFSQSLVDSGQVDRKRPFILRVYHDKSPYIEARIQPETRDGVEGFWIDMAVPTFGIAAVEASPEFVGASEFEGRNVSRVFELEKVDPRWTCSELVNVGNPHCVTFLKNPDLLPSMEQLGSAKLLPALTAIANSTKSDSPGAGRPCKNGINLQWASVSDLDTVDARVFERGEGPTLSSGTSATAVASAARKLNLVQGATINVRMTGGVAPVRFDQDHAMLFGEARRKDPPV